MDDATMINEAEQDAGQSQGAASAPKKGVQATPEQNDLLERVVVNAMKVISGEYSSTLDGIMQGGQSVGEGLANAITYVLQAVVGGLQKKGVDVPVEMILSENGVASQVTQLLVAMIGASGQDITPNEIQKALEIGLSNFGVKQGRQGAQAQKQMQGDPQQMPQQGAPPQGAGQQAPQGLLEGAQR